MSAVWRAARFGTGRRRLQSIIVAVVVAAATTATILAAGLLAQTGDVYRQEFNAQSGAHVVATFDNAAVSAQQLAAAPRTGVSAIAGPFPQADVYLLADGLPLAGSRVVGRAQPGGPVDDLSVGIGRWATQPGEIVLSRAAITSQMTLGEKVTLPRLTGQPALTLVGIAESINDTADAWVTPAQATTLQQLGAPASTQVLYRFTRAGTAAQIKTDIAGLTAVLPAGALSSAQSYLPSMQAADQPSPALPFLIAFAILGLIVAVVIVVNVVSGAVVTGFRTIGVLKTLGYTPAQVVGVYTLVTTIPAVVGAIVGTVAGSLLSTPLLAQASQARGLPIPLGRAGWIILVGLVGLPLLVAIAALGPASRAGRMSAIAAISTGRAPRVGHGYAAQRLLARTRLPRPIGMGLATPLARPARAAITLVAILLGTTTIIFSAGLTRSLHQAADDIGRPQIQIDASRESVTDRAERGTPPTISAADAMAAITSQPGTRHVAAEATIATNVIVAEQPIVLTAVQGGGNWLAYTIVTGHWPDRPGQALVAKSFLDATGTQIGDTVVVTADNTHLTLTLVGEMFGGNDNPIYTDWSTIDGTLSDVTATNYEIQLSPGTDPAAYARGLAAHPGLYAQVNQQTSQSEIVSIWTPLAFLLTLLFAAVAALGVFNTVLLNTRERGHDFGVLKTLGMTPRQVIAMVATSMVGVGLLAGILAIPIALAVHHLVLPAMADAADTVLPRSMLNAYTPVMLVALALSGLVIALLGALAPAIITARLKISENLRSE